MDLGEARRLAPLVSRHLPVMLTIRTCREGGSWEIDDRDRLELFRSFFGLVGLFDVEIESPLFAATSRRDFPAEAIVVTSFHDYHGIPRDERLEELIAKARKWGADITKLACRASGAAEVGIYAKLLDLQPSGSLCLIAMGDAVASTRFEFPRRGSVLTYGWLDRPAAPGQPSAKDLADAVRA
jgi:3-dehydroquinate dehydratase-1